MRPRLDRSDKVISRNGRHKFEISRRYHRFLSSRVLQAVRQRSAYIRIRRAVPSVCEERDGCREGETLRSLFAPCLSTVSRLTPVLITVSEHPRLRNGSFDRRGRHGAAFPSNTVTSATLQPQTSVSKPSNLNLSRARN